MLTFAIAVFLLIVTPGPGVLSTAGVGAAFGFRPGFAYVTGLFFGNLMVELAVISGLAAVVLGFPVIRTILMIASVGYLVYLAARIALAGSRIAFIEAKEAPGLGSGLLLQAINPKAYAVNTSLFSAFAFLPGSFGAEVAIKLLILNVIWVPIHLAWLYAGVLLRRLDLGPTAQRRINYAMAAAMLGVVVLAIAAAARAG